MDEYSINAWKLEINWYEEEYFEQEKEYFEQEDGEMITINELMEMAHENAKQKGFWEGKKNFGESIALIHSEVSEALEDFRNGYEPDELYWGDDKPCGIPIEFADIIIRILDLCGGYSIDINKAITLKMAYNLGRPYKHGKKI